MREKDAEIADLKEQKGFITEDDIKISKERQTCLVHKGPIEGYSFVCPECGAFYCQKCIDAIKQIENVCWSCGGVLDPSKPSKKEEFLKESEEDVEIEDISGISKHKNNLDK